MTTKVKTTDDRQKKDLARIVNLKNGFFQVNRCLFLQSTVGTINKSEFMLMIILLHLENQLVPGRTTKEKRGNWFFHSNKEICSYKLMNEATLMKARNNLVQKGYIEFKSGHTDISSQYRILDVEALN